MLPATDAPSFTPPHASRVRRWGWGTLLFTVAVGLLGWALVAVACLCVGSTGHFGWPASSAALAFRLEIVLLASLVGAALASSGVAYQAILRNPLADPYLLGVSSGAMLATYLWRLPAVAAALPAPLAAVSQQAFAFAGALATVAVVFGLATRRGRLEPVTLLLVGVIVNAVNGAVFLLLNTLIRDLPGTGGPLSFLVGAIQTTLLPEQQAAAAGVIFAGWLGLMFVTGQLNVASLGTDEAEALGVRIHRLRWAGLVTASLVTASAVAVSGPIGFVGLVCPHLARFVVGSDQRRLLPIATAVGASLLAIADAASRRLSQGDAAGTWLPVGVLTGLLGGPFFLLLLSRRNRDG